MGHINLSLSHTHTRTHPYIFSLRETPAGACRVWGYHGNSIYRCGTAESTVREQGVNVRACACLVSCVVDLCVASCGRHLSVPSPLQRWAFACDKQTDISSAVKHGSARLSLSHTFLHNSCADYKQIERATFVLFLQFSSVFKSCWHSMWIFIWVKSTEKHFWNPGIALLLPTSYAFVSMSSENHVCPNFEMNWMV